MSPVTTRSHAVSLLKAFLLLAASGAIGTPDARGQDYSVGVLSGDGTCPDGATPIVHRMDEEDEVCNQYETDVLYFGTWYRGWIGATYVQPSEENFSSPNNGGVHFAWCRVDGTQFKPLTTAYAASKVYAVLKLGGTCPLGSTEFLRYFDNEDYHNTNWLTGDLSPNVVDRNTTLRFCLFTSGASVMTRPPNLGVPYGVVALPAVDGQPFPFVVQSGYLHTNEEGFENANEFWAPAAIDADARRIVKPEHDGQTHTSCAGGVTIINLVQMSTGAEPRCGRCGGTVLADGACSVPTPPTHGQPCTGCAGTGVVQCDGSCTVYSPANFGQPCGCGGTVLCSGACSMPPCDPWGGCASRHCCEPGTTRCRICAPTNGSCP